MNYYEYRADGGYAWDVKYDLRFDGASFRVETRLNLVGADPGSALQQTWEQGIESIWNGKYSLSDGSRAYPITFDVRFVDIGGHYDVTVHDAYGHPDMLNWYTSTGWGPTYQDELAAHEFGHMIGAFDEYQGGATQNGYTTSGTLMSDLTPKVTAGYFSALDRSAEAMWGGSLTVVAAGSAPVPATSPIATKTGTANNDSLAGGSGRDSIGGAGGNDSIWGNGGDDILRGGTGRDLLYGGDGADLLYGEADADQLRGDLGNDTLWGGAGNDTLWGGGGADVFAFARGSNQDRIVDFSASQGDRIQLSAGMIHTVTGPTDSGGSYVDLGGGDRLILAGILPHQVQNGWFFYA